MQDEASVKLKRLKGVWVGMRARCYNTTAVNYERYGARGIKVCDEWKDSFENFADWAVSNGYDATLKKGECTLDRIDVNGNYEPNNCRWVNMTVQSRNRENSRYITYNGKKIQLKDFAEEYGISDVKFIWRRIEVGMSVDEILREWNIKHDKEHYMTVSESAEYYGVHIDTIKKWISRGRIKAELMRSGYYIPRGQELTRRIFRKVTQKEKEELKELYNMGISIHDLAKQFDMDRNTVSRALGLQEQPDWRIDRDRKKARKFEMQSKQQSTV